MKSIWISCVLLLGATLNLAPANKLANGVYAVLAEGRTAEEADATKALHVTLVFSPKNSEADQRTPPKYLALQTSPFVPMVLAGPPVANKDERGRALLNLTLTPQHAKALEDFTRAHLDQQVAIVIDDEIVTAPRVRSVIERGEVKLTVCADDGCQALLKKLSK